MNSPFGAQTKSEFEKDGEGRASSPSSIRGTNDRADKTALNPQAGKDGIISAITNMLFRHFTPVGKTMSLPPFSAAIYLTSLTLSVVLTFSLMMWYFSNGACVPTSIVFPGNPAQASITQDILDTPGYYVCLSGGVTPVRSEFDCCTVEGVKYYSDSRCDIFSTEIDACQDSDECYDASTMKYTLVVVQVIQCPNTAAALVNSFQYSMYISVALTAFFVVTRMGISQGLSKIISPKDWKEYVDSESKI
jgi:hypothetical protein